MRKEVEKALAEVRPMLLSHGGDAELVEVKKDGTVRLRLLGACAGCPMSTMTLAMGIERELKRMVPGVKRVEAV